MEITSQTTRGTVFEYTEQDIYEQLRKKLYPYEKKRY